jgi:hypothetical protein
MYIKERLVEIRALTTDDVSPSFCQLCSCEPAALAVWSVSLRTPGTLLQKSVVRTGVLACKVNCFPLKSAAVDAMVSTHDRFLAQQRTSRHTYSSLIDACSRCLNFVLSDRRLYNLYQRIYVLGETLGKSELDFAWMRLNSHFSASASKQSM